MNLNKIIELLNYLSKYSIVYGINDKDRNTKLEVSISNTDGTITNRELTAEDVMYFTEYGSIGISGKFILEKSLLETNKILDEELDKLINQILNEEGVTTQYIDTQINRICLKIQDYIRNYMRSYPEKNNILGSIIHKDIDENKYFYDLKKLSQYISCIAKFKN